MFHFVPATSIPILVEIPHASLAFPEQARAFFSASDADVVRDADNRVDELFAEIDTLGVGLLVSKVSRYVIDLNRGEHDVDDAAVERIHREGARFPRGVIWSRTTDEIPCLRAPLPRREFDHRIETYYRPYHATLRAELHRLRETYGSALLLCAHSMPTKPRPRYPNLAKRADLVPGSNGGSTVEPDLLRALDLHAAKSKISVAHDTPYKGGYSTRHYGQPRDRIEALQLEFARRLYVDEDTYERNEGFDTLAAFARNLVEELAETLVRRQR
ncbi:MAG: N-formylglutamate amidohydrolase [Polyangiaceae bacterium]|nr:N-formylglutamate amidohydrolase [Polyangiaceae bacterium]